jgi:dUTP pyrophosphatase
LPLFDHMASVLHYKVLIERVNVSARLPEKRSTFAAGYDLSAVEEVDIAPGYAVSVSTGLKMNIPLGYYGRIGEKLK